MAELPTLGVLGLTDGRLMGDIGDIYKVVSFFIGRDAFTHELPRYGRQIAPVLTEAFPDLAEDRGRDWKDFRDAALAAHGETVTVPDEWSGSLSDGKGPVETAVEALT